VVPTEGRLEMTVTDGTTRNIPVSLLAMEMKEMYLM
jgi:hypothetical protein